jgi:hypothetical protein
MKSCKVGQAFEKHRCYFGLEHWPPFPQFHDFVLNLPDSPEHQTKCSSIQDLTVLSAQNFQHCVAALQIEFVKRDHAGDEPSLVSFAHLISPFKCPFGAAQAYRHDARRGETSALEAILERNGRSTARIAGSEVMGSVFVFSLERL